MTSRQPVYRHRRSLAALPVALPVSIGAAIVVAMGAAAVPAGCSKNTPGGASSPHPESGKLSADVRQLLGLVPANAAFVAYVDSTEPFWDELVGANLLIKTSEQTEKALDADLRAFVKDRTGLDVSKFKAAVLYADPQSEGPAILGQGVSGKLPGEPAETYQDAPVMRLGIDLVIAQRGDVTVLGEEQAVRAALDVMAGKAKGMIAEATPLWKLIDAECSGAFVGAAVSPGEAPVPEIKAMAAQFGITDGCVFLGRERLRVVVRGDTAKLQGLADMANKAMKMGMQQLEREKQEATAPGAPVPQGIGAIFAYHRLKDIMGQFEPRVADGRLEVSLALEVGEPATLVALIGVGAAVAVPAFMKYTAKSKTAEAAQFVKIMYDGARAYYMDTPQPGLEPVPPSFPSSVGPTPPIGACCEQGGKCAPDAALWSEEAWAWLAFSVDDPHYYSYQFINNGDEFTARAYGDLDCDGVYSTFEMIGRVEDGEVSGTAALRRMQETE